MLSASAASFETLAPSAADATAIFASTCTGTSTKLPAAQCAAWVDFHVATGGNAWAQCVGAKTDPCSCIPRYDFGDIAVCDPTNTTVLKMYASARTL